MGDREFSLIKARLVCGVVWLWRHFRFQLHLWWKIDRFGGEAWEGAKQQSGGESIKWIPKERERKEEVICVVLF